MIYNNNDDVVKELKKVLIDNGIKQQFIADGIGVSKQGFNLMLNKKHITFDDIKKCLDVIGYKMQIEFIKE